MTHAGMAHLLSFFNDSPLCIQHKNCLAAINRHLLKQNTNKAFVDTYVLQGVESHTIVLPHKPSCTRVQAPPVTHTTMLAHSKY